MTHPAIRDLFESLGRNAAFQELLRLVSRDETQRIALNGDLDPKWTEVWAHINLGKIFDITDQRDRAVNEYRQALRTKDNTQGALEEAGKYTNEKYKRAANNN